MTENNVVNNMVDNSYGITRLSVLNNYALEPNGWCVREKINEEGKAVSLEFGCYLTDEVFISVPIHFSLKDKLLPIATKSNEFTYYAVPKNMKFAVSKYTNKKGKECPILVAPSAKYPEVFISAMALDFLPNNIVINANVNDGVKIVRKFIDKDRRVIGIIAFTEYKDTNAEIVVNVSTGNVGGHTLNKATYTFVPQGITTVTETVETTNPVETEYINLPSFIRPGAAKSNNKRINKRVNTEQK